MPDRTITDATPDPPPPTGPFPGEGTITHPYPVVANAVRTAEPTGERIGDFILLETLGQGAFGTVYLALQHSLDRLVALKVAAGGRASRGEALTLAGLDHDHIVKVFAEYSDSPTNRHCLALQYVPGTNLSEVIRILQETGTPPVSGQSVLTAIDRLSRGESRFDPGALRDREIIAAGTFIQAVCRLGEQLARALAFAHSQNVLHCDIKPANILITAYARPLLADFNVSFDRERRDPGDHRVGGTLRYMAPEHYAALRGEPHAQVDERSDIYSLGVVLQELATGTVTTENLTGPHPGIPRELLCILKRCRQSDPAQRYSSATDLADALAAAREILETHRALPPVGRLGAQIVRHPYLAITLFALLPHLLATVLNIGYNSVQIRLMPAQEQAFSIVILWYNVLIYGAVFITGWKILKWQSDQFQRLATLENTEVDRLRHRVLTLGYWAIGLAVAGWIPGGVIFPLWIDATSDPLQVYDYAHFLVSFTLSGLVGVVFSYLGIQVVVLRSLYPALGNPDNFSAEQVSRELWPILVLFAPCLILSSALPLTGAVLLLVFSDDVLVDGRITFGFRVLVVGLIGLGMLGVSLASRLTSRLNRLAGVWANLSRTPGQHR